MARANTKRTKQSKREAQYARENDPVVTFYPPKHAKPATRPLEPRTDKQGLYMRAIASHDVIFALGPAGTGKTYIPCAMAAQELMARRISKIIVTRPAVEAGGEKLGFLPGELEEKYEPYIAPVRKALTERMGKGHFEACLKDGKIEPYPLGFMRGETFEDAWVILDEAQNVTPELMKMFLTRIGENCKVIICGDTDQVDIEGMAGLIDAQQRTAWSERFATVEFDESECVRSGVVLDVLKSYRR
jgi:phosphate starvation-inducible protein PhoH and related proteins